MTVSPECAAATQSYREAVRSLSLSRSDRDAIARVTIAEAGDQGDVGMAAVVHTVVNRLIDGRFGDSAQKIVDAPHQFEPAHRAGGWRNLPKPTTPQKARIDAMINLILEGYVVDPSGGAAYFQNPAVVAEREKAGSVSKGLTRFGGRTPSAVIRDHEFYADIGVERSVAAKRKTNPAPVWDVYAVAASDDAWNAFSQERSLKTQEQ